MLHRTHLLALAAVSLSVACGGSSAEDGSEQNAGALQEQAGAPATTGDVEITVKASDSADAKKFISAFARGFDKIMDIDHRDGVPGVSTREEEEDDGVQRTKRNDGTISCTKLDECTFKLRRVSIVDGNAVSKGDRNYWAGQLFSIFVSYSGGDIDNPGSRDAAVVIGKKGVVPNIECKNAGTERGLEVAQCTFNTKK